MPPRRPPATTPAPATDQDRIAVVAGRLAERARSLIAEAERLEEAARAQADDAATLRMAVRLVIDELEERFPVVRRKEMP